MAEIVVMESLVEIIEILHKITGLKQRINEILRGVRQVDEIQRSIKRFSKLNPEIEVIRVMAKNLDRYQIRNPSQVSRDELPHAERLVLVRAVILIQDASRKFRGTLEDSEPVSRLKRGDQ